MALNDADRKRIITDAIEVALQNLNLDGEYEVQRVRPDLVNVFVKGPAGFHIYEVKTSWRAG